MSCRMGRAGVALVLFLALAGSAAAETIAAIRFEGNDRTRKEIMLREMTVAVGDAAVPAEIERSRQAIMDLGLFRSVKTRLEPAGKGQDLIVTVEEKFYAFLLPRLDVRANGGYSYGAEARFDNLAGLDQRLELLVRAKESGEDDGREETREFGLSYAMPRVADTAYNAELAFGFERSERSTEEAGAHGRFEEDIVRFRIGVSRWLLSEGPSRGWLAGFGVGFEHRGYDPLSGDPTLLDDEQSVDLTGELVYDAVHDHGNYRTGHRFGLHLSAGFREIGSDFDYARSVLYLRRYNSVGPYTNVDWQLQLGLASGERFDERAWDIGGEDSLRGLEDGTAEGNALLLFNLQYLRPLYRQVRWVAFTDIGNVYPGPAELDPTDLRTGVGLGLRWPVTLFVDVTLRADLAYSIQANEYHSYLGTNVAF